MKRSIYLLKRTELSANSVLNKPVVSYDYHDVVINSTGNAMTYLNEESTHINLSVSDIKRSPAIYAKFISDSILSVMNNQKKWFVVMLP